MRTLWSLQWRWTRSRAALCRIKFLVWRTFFPFGEKADVYDARARTSKCFDHGVTVGEMEDESDALSRITRRARTSPKVVTSSRNRFPYFLPAAILRSAELRLFIRASYNEGLRGRDTATNVCILSSPLPSFLPPSSAAAIVLANRGGILIGRLRCINPR